MLLRLNNCEIRQPRPITWLPRLQEIRRSVKNSARSHYERKDIERLFELQPRAAQALVLGVSPAAKVGRSFILARGDLEAFHDRIHEGAHPDSLLSPRSEPVPRRRLRQLVQVDRVPARLDEAPGNIQLSTGRARYPLFFRAGACWCAPGAGRDPRQCGGIRRVRGAPRAASDPARSGHR